MNKLTIFFFLLFAGGCKDKFNISLKETDKSLLVVEGSLKVGQDSTTITVSKTVKISDKISIKPVLKAQLSVEDKNGRSVSLIEKGNGIYSINNLSLVAGNEYRLRIRADNKEYLSDFVPAMVTPPIDSISWEKDNGDMIIYANTHDPTNNTWYYKWDYDETWEILSYYVAGYQYVGGSTVIVSPYWHNQCWKYSKSPTINISSSVLLSSDIISEAPLLVIPKGSEKLSVRYSILVKQESLTKKAYEYLAIMKKNTESLGSIFDPQPSELKGNIHCLSNPDEGVIGYVTSSSVNQKRIFITKAEAGWNFVQSCGEILKVKNHPDSIKLWFPGFLPWGEELTPIGTIDYYLSSTPTCVDCTKRGGSLIKPVYW